MKNSIIKSSSAKKNQSDNTSSNIVSPTDDQDALVFRKSLTPASILSLQRTLGNKFVQKFLSQTKAKTNDSQIMRMFKMKPFNGSDDNDQEEEEKEGTSQNPIILDEDEDEQPTTEEKNDGKRKFEVYASVNKSNEKFKKNKIEKDMTAVFEESSILENIVNFISYEDLPSFMQTCKLFFNTTANMIKEYSFPYKGEEEIESPMYLGVIKIMARYNPNSSLSEESLDEEDYFEQFYSPLITEITKALGWREYTSTLRKKDKNTELTIVSFSTQIWKHFRQTSMLREIQSSKKDKGTAFPKKNFGIGLEESNKYASRENISKYPEWGNKLANHWNELQRIKGSGVQKPLDKDAYQKAEQLGQLGGGGNISVVEDEEKQKKLYSNNQLSKEEIEKLKEEDYEVKNGTKEDRKDWEEKHGKNRKQGNFPDLPFHSEMQQTEEKEPWEMGYTGNQYQACIQCLVAYSALGLEKGKHYMGTHGAKAASVIPPKIRQMSVYLQHYLDSENWSLLAKLLEDYASIKEIIESEGESIVGKYDFEMGGEEAIQQYIKMISSEEKSLDKASPTYMQYIAFQEILERKKKLETQIKEFFDFLDLIEREGKDFYKRLKVKGPEKYY
jgi:hypothetical protein